MRNSLKWPFKLAVPAFVVVATATMTLTGTANAATHGGAPAARPASHHHVFHVHPMCGHRPMLDGGDCL